MTSSVVVGPSVDVIQPCPFIVVGGSFSVVSGWRPHDGWLPDVGGLLDVIGPLGELVDQVFNFLVVIMLLTVVDLPLPVSGCPGWIT